jgi:hypothetical protein
MILVDDKRQSWNCLMIPQKAQLLRLTDLMNMAKITVDDRPWHLLEQQLENNYVECVLGVADAKTKKVMLLDIPETEQAI